LKTETVRAASVRVAEGAGQHTGTLPNSP